MTSYTKIAEQVSGLVWPPITRQQLYAWATRGTVNLNGQPFPGLDDIAAIAAWSLTGTRPGPKPELRE